MRYWVMAEGRHDLPQRSAARVCVHHWDKKVVVRHNKPQARAVKHYDKTFNERPPWWKTAFFFD